MISDSYFKLNPISSKPSNKQFFLKSSISKFIDLNKDTLEETTSQDTGMTSQIVKDWRTPGSSKQPNYRPRIEIVDEKDTILKLKSFLLIMDLKTLHLK